jgi:hypothetical protein
MTHLLSNSFPQTINKHKCHCGRYIGKTKTKLVRHQQGRNCGSSPLLRMKKKSEEQFPGCFSLEGAKFFKGLLSNIYCLKCNNYFETHNHLSSKYGGCPDCHPKPTFTEFLRRAMKQHGSDFQYDESSFTNVSGNITVTHISCGRSFSLNAASHLKGMGCYECLKCPTPLDPIILNMACYKGKILIHPIYKNYAWDVDNNCVINLKTNHRFGKNRKRRRWYEELKIVGKTTYTHIFKYECFHQVDATGYEIDHINNNHTDDRIENLQRLTRLDHHRKTTAQHNGNTALKISKTQGVSGIARNPQTNEEISFTSITELSKRLPNIHRFLKTGKYPPNGFSEITFHNDEEYIDGEIWQFHPHHGFEVSNHGRIKNRRRITRGTEGVGGYMMYSGKRVHVLVAETFLGPKPSPEHTVDHIDRDIKNNRVYNLRWASRHEQLMNRDVSLYTYTQVNGFNGNVLAIFTNLQETMVRLNTSWNVVNTTSGKRNWFIYKNITQLRQRRIEFVRKRLGMTKGIMQHQRWSTVASGFFDNTDKQVRNMHRARGISAVDKDNFHKKQNASNCIKYHIKSYINFKTLTNS